MLENPLRIDRTLKEVARARAAFRRKLRHDSAEDHAFEHVGERVSDELLEELRGDGDGDPLGPALHRWAYVLREEHALIATDRALAEAWHVERHPLDQPLGGSFTLAELRARALGDRRGGRRLFLDAWLARSGKAGELALRRWEERAEHAARLRIADLDALEHVTQDVFEHANAWLETTNEAFAALGVRDTTELVTLALGEDATATWPTHLSTRSLVRLFDEPAWFKHVELELEGLVAPLGTASFLRGLDALGRGLRKRFVSSALPFAAAEDPYELEASVWGALFALLPFGESFATRRLGVAKNRLGDHRRSLARVYLIGARAAAMRALSRSAALAGERSARKSFRELGERAFTLELPPNAAGALFCPEPDSPQRFAALALAAELERRLTETHDEDWYRNPRAVAELREEAARAPETEIAPERLKTGLQLLGERLSA
ncbi:MAG TPA: hypothetical protein VGK73_12510 [Polyangiaceae bacterium]